MRFALLAPQFAYPKTGGVGPHARKLGEALVGLGDAVLIVSEGPVPPQPGPIVAVSIGPSWTVLSVARAVRLIWQFRADVLLVEYTPFNFGPRSLAPMLIAAAARASRIHVATYVHEIFYQAGSPAVASAAKARILALRDAFMLFCSQKIFVANVVKRERLLDFAHFVAKASVEVIPIGANIEPGELGMWDAEKADQSVIMSFGVVMPRRRFELLIGALARLVQRGRDLHLRLVGNIFDRSYAERCHDLAAALGVAERVTMTGPIEDSQVNREFRNAFVYAYALEDGVISSSGSLLAALAHGIPIVAERSATDEPELAACTLRASGEGALADAIESVLDDAAIRLDLAKAGRALYHARYEWEAIARKLRQCFK